MKGFKDSTKTQYSMGGSCYAKGGAVKGAAKISKVMGEFKSGELHSGSKKGPVVTNPKQATAIALSEARKAGAKVPAKKYQDGGAVARGNRAAALEQREEAALVAEGIRKAAREAKRGNPYTKPEAIRKTTTTVEVAPVDRAERAARAARAAKAQKGRFMDEPIVRDVMGALGFNKGGLCAMPKGKR